jgi:cellulose synthase/poly-beta-1,6-N-acetylglucosamine synthase-like glycosyltransferase
VVLVSDGSVDDTAVLMHAWTDAPFGMTVVSLPQSLGKGAALAAGLARAPASDLVVVFDADCEPEPDVLQWLAGAFDDPSIGAATGYPRPANANRGRVARYAALERWCHHLVVLAGLDRLRLNPPVIGVAFAVRWAALQSAGGFPVGRLAEDLELSMALTARGWRTRWIGSAIVRENVVETPHAFRQQRTRWSRGMLQSAPRTRSLQELLTAAGYLDRTALIMAVLLVPFGVVEVWWPALYLLLPFLTVLQAMRKAAARPAWKFLVALAGMVATDVAISVRSAAAQLAGTATRWEDRQS